MRVNDLIMRYMTVRVDEERKTAEKHRTRREERLSRRNTARRGGDETETVTALDAQINQ